MHPYVRVLQAYMDALGRSDYGTVKSLFTPGGRVKSPFSVTCPQARSSTGSPEHQPRMSPDPNVGRKQVRAVNPTSMSGRGSRPGIQLPGGNVMREHVAQIGHVLGVDPGVQPDAHQR